MRLDAYDKWLLSGADQEDPSEAFDGVILEIEQDCLAGNGSEHFDFDDTIHPHRNAISKILVQYHRMLRPADECAKELIELLSALHEKAIDSAAHYDLYGTSYVN